MTLNERGRVSHLHLLPFVTRHMNDLAREVQEKERISKYLEDNFPEDYE